MPSHGQFVVAIKEHGGILTTREVHQEHGKDNVHVGAHAGASMFIHDFLDHAHHIGWGQPLTVIQHAAFDGTTVPIDEHVTLAITGGLRMFHNNLS